MRSTEFWRGPWGARLFRARRLRAYRWVERTLDLLQGMETRRQVDPENHGFDPALASCYVPTAWWALPYILSRIPRRPGELFLDVGCGKGRALKIACAFPFARVVGIELIPSVAETARRNLRSEPRVEILTGDARLAPLPEGPCLVYLFNPFALSIWQELLDRLHSTAAPGTRILCHSPVYHDTLMRRGDLVDRSAGTIPDEALEEFRLYELWAKPQSL